MKVLLPIDFSDSSETVVKGVERRPWPGDTEIAVLHVVDWSGWMDLSPYIKSQTERAKGLAWEAANAMGRRSVRRGPSDRPRS